MTLKFGRRPALACFLLLALPAFSAHAGRAYVSNEDGQSVSVIDTDTQQVISTIEVGKRPRGLKLNSDGTRLYVAVSGLPECPPSVPDEECAKQKRDLSADGIAIVDTRANKLLKVLKAGSDPEQFDLSKDGKRMFVANEDVATASVVDIDSGKVVAAVCHAPWLLVELDAVRGLNVTSYHSIKKDVINAGGKWVDREVVTDRGIITAAGSAPVSFAVEILKHLGLFGPEAEAELQVFAAEHR